MLQAIGRVSKGGQSGKTLSVFSRCTAPESVGRRCLVEDAWAREGILAGPRKVVTASQVLLEVGHFRALYLHHVVSGYKSEAKAAKPDPCHAAEVSTFRYAKCAAKFRPTPASPQHMTRLQARGKMLCYDAVNISQPIYMVGLKRPA